MQARIGATAAHSTAPPSRAHAHATEISSPPTRPQPACGRQEGALAFEPCADLTAPRRAWPAPTSVHPSRASLLRERVCHSVDGGGREAHASGARERAPWNAVARKDTTSGSVAAFATSEPSLALSRDPTRWARSRHWRKSEQIQIPRYFCGLAVHGLISQQVSNYVLMKINYIRSKHSSFRMFQAHVNKTREWM